LYTIVMIILLVGIGIMVFKLFKNKQLLDTEYKSILDYKKTVQARKKYLLEIIPKAEQAEDKMQRDRERAQQDKAKVEQAYY